MIDYSWLENVGEFFGIGKSLGPAQIRLDTAIKNGIIFTKDEYLHWTRLLSQHLAESGVTPPLYPTYWSWARSELDGASGIHYAAKLMSRYLTEVCKSARAGGARDRKVRVNGWDHLTFGCDVEDFCCAEHGCNTLIKSKVPICLAQGMGAIWNNGLGIMLVDDIYHNSKNGWDHGHNAGLTLDKLNDSPEDEKYRQIEAQP
jgi:hypothetical protein